MPEVRHQVSEGFLIPGICRLTSAYGAVAQLGEHLLCKQGVTGSIPVGSTRAGPWEPVHIPRDKQNLGEIMGQGHLSSVFRSLSSAD